MKKALIQRYDNELDILAIERLNYSDVYTTSASDDFEIVVVVPTRDAKSDIAVVADARSKQYAPTTRGPWPGRDDQYPVRIDVANVRYTTVPNVRHALAQAGKRWQGAWRVMPAELDERLLLPDDVDLAADVDRTGSALDEELAAVEGEQRVRLVKHRRRERRLRAAKIASFKQDHEGRLFCEVPRCGFDFEQVYGAAGKDYAQVHHLTPLASLDQPVLTELPHLAVVCANCHAMIHRGGKCRKLKELIPRG